jgi:hypothetical protein
MLTHFKSLATCSSASSGHTLLIMINSHTSLKFSISSMFNRYNSYVTGHTNFYFFVIHLIELTSHKSQVKKNNNYVHKLHGQQSLRNEAKCTFSFLCPKRLYLFASLHETHSRHPTGKSCLKVIPPNYHGKCLPSSRNQTPRTTKLFIKGSKKKKNLKPSTNAAHKAIHSEEYLKTVT